MKILQIPWLEGMANRLGINKVITLTSLVVSFSFHFINGILPILALSIPFFYYLLFGRLEFKPLTPIPLPTFNSRSPKKQGILQKEN